MSDGINKVTLMGNLGADAELKTTDKGPVLKFRLATSHSWVDKENNKQEKTDWHHVVMFGKRADALSKYLHKGSRICVLGRIQTHSYEKENQKHWFTEIVAEDIQFAGGPTNGASKPSPAKAQPAVSAPPF